MIFSNVTFIIGQNDYKGVLQSGNYQRIHSSFFHSPLVCLPGVALSSTPKARLPNDHHPIYTLVFAYNPSLKHPACRRPTDIIAERIGTTKERIQATKGRFCVRYSLYILGMNQIYQLTSVMMMMMTTGGGGRRRM